MPQFPGPMRPSRPGDRPESGSSLTRRGLLGGLVLVVGAGAADAVRWATRAASPSTSATPAGLPPRLINLLTGSLRPSGTSP
ncbi:MAG: hypothetical protein ACTHK4_07340, partial [Mycobacteriales bacterium]